MLPSVQHLVSTTINIVMSKASSLNKFRIVIVHTIGAFQICTVIHSKHRII